MLHMNSFDTMLMCLSYFSLCFHLVKQVNLKVYDTDCFNIIKCMNVAVTGNVMDNKISKLVACSPWLPYCFPFLNCMSSKWLQKEALFVQSLVNEMVLSHGPNLTTFYLWSFFLGIQRFCTINIKQSIFCF